MKYINGGWIHSDFAKNAVVSLVDMNFIDQISTIKAQDATFSEDMTGISRLDQPIIIRIGIVEEKMAIIEGEPSIKYALNSGFSHLPATFQISNHIPERLLPFSYSLSVYTLDPDLVDLWVSHGKVIKFNGYEDVKYVHPELILLPEYLENHFFE